MTKQGGCNFGYNFRVKGYNLSDVLIYLPINPKYNIILCNKFTFLIISEFFGAFELAITVRGLNHESN